MRKTVILAALLAAIIVVIAVFALRKSAKEDANANYEGNFTIENTDQIGKIILTHRAAETYTLTRTRDGWLINEKYPARMSSVQPLLDAMRMVQIRYIPGDKAIPNVLENIEGTYVHAQVFDRQGNLMKAYKVGGVPADERGTYMLMDGSKQPFVVHIPSWDGALRTRYALNLADWRDRHFMNLSADEIASVKVEYPQQQSQSFLLERSGGSFQISPVNPALRDYPKNYEQGTGDAFLKSLTEAACEGFENEYPFRDSILNLVPFCHMLITKKNDEVVEVKVWPKGVPVYTQNSSPVHRLFIQRTPGDFVLAQYEVIKGIFRGYDFFTGRESNLLF